MWLKDPKTGQASVSLTAFVTGYLTALAKLVFSGVTLKGITLAPFSGIEFAAVVGALGTLYHYRRKTSNDSSKL